MVFRVCAGLFKVAMGAFRVGLIYRHTLPFGSFAMLEKLQTLFLVISFPCSPAGERFLSPAGPRLD
jgi:uncharacterized membrane protein